MMQTFEYPNMLSGTRSGEGWFLYDTSGAGYNHDTGIELYNAKPTEDFLYSPPVVLHKDTDYTLHCFADNTSNMSSTELWVLDMGKVPDGYNWIGGYVNLDTPGPGGGCGSMPRSDSMATHGTECHSIFASTTTAPRTARTASSGSATSCLWRARSRGHGHRRQGRCGLNE
jgi:hypothetical protein